MRHLQALLTDAMFGAARYLHDEFSWRLCTLSTINLIQIGSAVTRDAFHMYMYKGYWKLDNDIKKEQISVDW